MNDDVKQDVKHLLDNVKKEEKGTEKEETQEGERDSDIDNSSNSSLGGECACARVGTPPENQFLALFVSKNDFELNFFE